ncbi:MAG: hydrolase [Betaproteobacteria bacterium]|nr:hydrolase [Betaproteobacteria bacterium]
MRELVRAARKFNEAAHVPLVCADARVGWLRRAHAQKLLRWPYIFKRGAQGVTIAESLKTAAGRTAAINDVVHALHAEGAISGWRDERYVVSTAFDAPPLFDIERAAARFFGTTTYAAHANGYCGEDMWLARRAATKPIDPNLLDNLVGGGMCAGVSPLATIVREAWEEAGIPQPLAVRAQSTDTLEVLREVPEGVQSEVIFVFDLELPPDFVPHSEDGEVVEFRRLPFTRAFDIADGKLMTLDASLVAQHFLQRRARGT